MKVGVSREDVVFRSQWIVAANLIATKLRGNNC